MSRSASWRLAVLLLAGATMALPARAERLHREKVCRAEAAQLAKRIAKLPIPVGCELVDCCPGCPAEGPLDWRIRVGGDALAGVRLRFEDLPGGVGGLALEGAARPDDGAIALRPGAAQIRGLPRVREGPVPVASLAVELADEAGAASAVSRPSEGRGRIEIAIDQMLGSVVVDRFRMDAVLTPCGPVARPQACDTLTLQDNLGGDLSTVLFDAARSAACDDDVVDHTASSLALDDMRAAGGCRSELAVFSRGNAMFVRVPEEGWKDGCGDAVEAPLAPILEAPVTLWLGAKEMLKDLPSEDLASGDLANALLLYDLNRTGIAFLPKLQRLSGPKSWLFLGTVAALSIPHGPCKAVGALQDLGFYDAGRLNVYYLPLVPFTGVSCPSDRNAIFVGWKANLATLAHEFGHAFSLFGEEETGGHATAPDFTPQNIMWGGGPATRDRFSLGQAYRFNVDPRSQLNQNGVRSGFTRECQALLKDDACPALDLD